VHRSFFPVERHAHPLCQRGLPASAATRYDVREKPEGVTGIDKDGFQPFEESQRRCSSKLPRNVRGIQPPLLD
jgi:hypothetical protein